MEVITIRQRIDPKTRRLLTANEFLSRTVEVYKTYLHAVDRRTAYSAQAEVRELRKQFFGPDHTPTPGAALRPPLRKAA